MRKILLNLEISTKCRAACSMCPRKHVPKNKFIDDDLVNIISKELDDTFGKLIYQEEENQLYIQNFMNCLVL